MSFPRRLRDLFTPTYSLVSLVLFAALAAFTEGQLPPDTVGSQSSLDQIDALEAKLLNLMEKVRALEEAKNTDIIASKRGFFSFPRTRLQTRNKVYLPPSSYSISADGPVALYVSLTSKTTVPAGGLVPYGQLYTSSGLGTNWQPETATFVSPRDCHYLVSIAVLAKGMNMAALSLRRNQRSVFQATSDTRKGTYTQGGGTVILQLKAGDTLSVRSVYRTTLNGDDTNTFSVYCLDNRI